MEGDTSPFPHPSTFIAHLRPWLDSCRWFHAEKTAPVHIQSWALLEEENERAAFWIVLRCGAHAYNVPIVLRKRHDEEHASLSSYVSASDRGYSPVVKEHANAIASWEQWDIFDATALLFGQKALFHMLFSPHVVAMNTYQDHQQEEGDGESGEGEKVFDTLRSDPHATLLQVAHASRVSSEQSNTSIIYTLTSGPQIIVKIFRLFMWGKNPDVELPVVLAPTGSVPEFFSSTSLVRTHENSPEQDDVADVALAQEFLAGSRDAWQVVSTELSSLSTQSAQEEASSIASMRDLGELTARIHSELAHAFPVITPTSAMRKEIRTAWRERARVALETVEQLREYEGAIEMVYSACAHVHWPQLQRIHGDYHLGQVLNAPGRGWFALDFEGEPLRPLSQRIQPDLALRDVAGMLRSFDYAVQSAIAAGGDRSRLEAWRERTSAAFIEGYGGLSQEEEVLLDALMLDKALYEVCYEAQHRPTWIHIPLAGVAHVVEKS